MEAEIGYFDPVEWYFVAHLFKVVELFLDRLQMSAINLMRVFSRSVFGSIRR